MAAHAGAVAGAAGGAPVTLELLLRPKGAFETASFVSGGATEARQLSSGATVLPDGDVCAFSPDGGRLAIATAASVQVFSRCVGGE